MDHGHSTKIDLVMTEWTGYLTSAGTHQSGVQVERAHNTRWLGTCEVEVVPQDDCASVDMEITDGSFHASFVAMRQL